VWFTDELWHFFLADPSGNFAVVEYDMAVCSSWRRPCQTLNPLERPASDVLIA